ncbi:MAG: magnesium transporter [Gammaproteobacteria bacterium]|jgi:magnesium transporter
MQAPKTQDKLQENITLVRELLKKHKLVEAIVHGREVHNKALVESLVHRQNLAELQNRLTRMHTGDVAHILEVLPLDDRLIVWQQVRESRGGEILLEVSDAVRESLIENMSNDELLGVLHQMDGDDLAYIADDIPDHVLEIRRQSLTEQDRNWLRDAMTYEEDTVGDLMSNEMVVVRDTDTLEQAAVKLRSLDELPIHNDKLFVVDRRGILKGVISLQNILLHDPQLPIGKVMATDIVKFAPDDDASEASKAFERYDLVSAPVVNNRGKLIGRVTVDVIMDYLRDESTEDVLNMAGLAGEEDLFAPVLDSVKNRGLWLAINLCAAFIVSRVIGLFEGTIAQLVSLAVLMPIVASVGGNIGNQTAALIIRAITLGQIGSENAFHLVRKELAVSILNGMLLGVVVALFTYVIYQNVSLAMVIGVAMILTLIVAAIIGFSVPLLLDKTGHDPALGSSIITTATTDSMGFFIFLGLATLFLI